MRVLLLLLAACRRDPVDTDTEPPDTDVAPTYCETLGQPEIPLAEGTGAAPYAIAGDFALPVRGWDGADATFRWSDVYTGCESVVFVMRHPDYGFTNAFLRDVDELIAASPPNAHYVVLSAAEGDELLDDVDDVWGDADEAFATLDAEAADHWRQRVHVVTEPAFDLDGWPGDFLRAYPLFAFGVDRRGRIREGGLLQDVGTGRGELSYAAHEARYFEFEAARDAALGDAIVVRAFDHVEAADPGWAGASSTVDVQLPADLAWVDTLELDLELMCGGRETDDCGAWDYLVHLYLCDADDPEVCDVEIGRWVTPYARAGRWVTDVSPLLALVEGGTTRRLRFYTQQPYTVTLDLRFSSRGKGHRPRWAAPLWSGGAFDQGYDALHAPLDVEVPAEAVKVELFATLSGHGWGADTENCAEFCDHQHHFDVNGAVFTREHPDAGTATGCLDRVGEGVVPNQWGTWPYGRGGWCPGQEVRPYVADVTAAVTPGEAAHLAYTTTVDGEPYVPEITAEGFWANIQLTSFLVASW